MRSSWMLFRGQGYSALMCLAPVIRPERPAPKGQESMLSWPLRATDWKRPNSFGPCDSNVPRALLY
jgi:hypothetical protein